MICGASMHYDWNSFYLFAHFIGSFALLPINCTLSHDDDDNADADDDDKYQV